MVTEPFEKVKRSVSSLIAENPFFAFILMGVRFEEAPVRSLSLSVSKSGDFILRYNPFVAFSKSEADLRALILHELLHIVNRHYLIKVSDERDRKLWDLAKDAAINQFIPELDARSIPLNVLVEEGHSVDNDVIFVGAPVDMLNRTAEEYHDYILKRLQELGRFDVEAVVEKLPNSHEDAFDLPLDMVLELLQERVGKAFNLFGHELPSGLRDVVQKELGKPVVNWKMALLRFVGLSQRGDRYQTPLRPNRRYEDQPGWRYVYEPLLAVIIDTSGSILEEELNKFLTEIEAIAREGLSFTLIQVDRSVTFVTRYSGGAWRELQIFGGGETDLQPAVDLAEREYRAEGLIVFTDGFVDVPRVSRRVLFVLSQKFNNDFYVDAKRLYGCVYVLE